MKCHPSDGALTRPRRIVPPVILGQAAQAFSSMADINQSSRVLWRLVDAAVMPGTPAYVRHAHRTVESCR